MIAGVLQSEFEINSHIIIMVEWRELCDACRGQNSS